MGIDSRYHPPAKIKGEDLEEFLLLLGYEKFRAPKFLREYKATAFNYFSKQPYESLQGVSFTVMIAMFIMARMFGTTICSPFKRI